MPVMLLVAAACLPAGLRAESYVDVYAGRTSGGSVDVITSWQTSSDTEFASASISPDSSLDAGVRVRFWGDKHRWFGGGVELGYSEVHGAGFDMDVLSLPLFLAFRAPLLATPNIPGGRLQPYALVGIAIYLPDATVDLGGDGGGSSPCCLSLIGGGCDNDEGGPYLVAGLAWQPWKTTALFAEYRSTVFSFGYETSQGFLFQTGEGRVDVDINTDHLLIGLSWRFS